MCCHWCVWLSAWLCITDTDKVHFAFVVLRSARLVWDGL
jgi:hypothetical protein